MLDQNSAVADNSKINVGIRASVPNAGVNLT